ncbi:MAG: hypothetical protein PVH61_44185 [Candidatus Aminicenantes bacterium]|jgi:hypothetical protein
MKCLIITLTALMIILSFPASTLAGNKITISVKVKPTKSDGKAWDFGGGAPDIKIKLYHPDLGKKSSPTAKDTYETSYTFDIGDAKGKLDVELWDMDLAAHDYIGGCQIHYATTGEYNCGRATIYVR